MPLYEASTRSILVTATALAPLVAFRGSTSKRVGVREIHLFTVTAPTTVGAIGIMRSTAIAVTPTGAVVGLARDPAESVSTAQLETGWATAPTVGAVGTVLRRATFPASVGQGLIWTFDAGDLMIPVGSGATGEVVLVNLNATAPGTYDITVVYED